MKRLLNKYAILLFEAFLFVGCDVHQWPAPYGDDNEPTPTPEPTPDYPPISIPISLEYETDFYVWNHKYDPVLGRVEESDPSLTIFPDYPGTSDKYSGKVPSGIAQTHIRVYPTSNLTRYVADKTAECEIYDTYNTDINLEIRSGIGTYDIVAWTQLQEYSSAQPFYNHSDFNRIHIITDNYRGNTEYRDGFRGRIRIDAAAEIDGRYIVRMERPMAKFELLTTDLSEFLERETQARGLSTRARAEDYRVVISFPIYYPSAYSAMEDRLVDSATRMSFETRMTVTGESEASLGLEYVMLNNINDGGVQTQVDVYRLDGTRVAGSSMFTIPLRRSHHTLLRGAFLSMEGNGGVGLDPSFNGDWNVPLW